MSDPVPAPSTKSEVKHVGWSDVPLESVNPLFDRQLLVGEQMMVARIIMKKGAVVPLHSHHNEQISHAQSGSLQFSIDGRELTLRAGEFLCIPPHVPHSAVALEDFVGIDLFTPPREDWLNKTDQYLRK